MEIRKVKKSFGNLEAIKEIQFGIPLGQFTSIIGRSGCGKSTLLKIVAGLIKPTKGEVIFDNNEGCAIYFPSIGYVPQEIALFPNLTVRENIGFPLKLKSFSHLKSKAKEIVDSLMKTMGLYDFRDYYPNVLSGGTKRKVSIARAFSINPDLLLLDEPFSSLDEITREILQDELYRIWLKFKPSIVMTTHSIAEAVYLSERVVILSDRPATIKGIVEINFHSRDDLRIKEEYFLKQKEVRGIFER